MLHRLDRDEMVRYMRNRAAKGFTVIQTVILSEIEGLTFPNMEGNLPLEEFDIQRPNEAYFQLVDFAVRKAGEFGLVLALLPTWHSWVLPGSHPLVKEKAVIGEKVPTSMADFSENATGMPPILSGSSGVTGRLIPRSKFGMRLQRDWKRETATGT